MMMCILACLYFSAGLADIDHLPATWNREYWLPETPKENPYGTLELGWSVSVGHFDWELAAQHMSSPKIDVTTGPKMQRDMNSIQARVRWFPWRQ